jgi:hypothetical protein
MRPGSWSDTCSARWTRCGSFSWNTRLKPRIIGRSAPCDSPSCGGNDPTGPIVTKALGGLSASCRSKKPAVYTPAPPTPCSSTLSVAPSMGNAPIQLGSNALSPEAKQRAEALLAELDALKAAERAKQQSLIRAADCVNQEGAAAIKQADFLAFFKRPYAPLLTSGQASPSPHSPIQPDRRPLLSRQHESRRDLTPSLLFVPVGLPVRSYRSCLAGSSAGDGRRRRRRDQATAAEPAVA